MKRLRNQTVMSVNRAVPSCDKREYSSEEVHDQIVKTDNRKQQ